MPLTLSVQHFCVNYEINPFAMFFFRIALSDAIKNWDRDEKIGDVFVASFSKAVVLEIYSEFINNFTAAMECAKQESKRKSALADFLKVKQVRYRK